MGLGRGTRLELVETTEDMRGLLGLVRRGVSPDHKEFKEHCDMLAKPLFEALRCYSKPGRALRDDTPPEVAHAAVAAYMAVNGVEGIVFDGADQRPLELAAYSARSFAHYSLKGALHNIDVTSDDMALCTRVAEITDVRARMVEGDLATATALAAGYRMKSKTIEDFQAVFMEKNPISTHTISAPMSLPTKVFEREPGELLVSYKRVSSGGTTRVGPNMYHIGTACWLGLTSAQRWSSLPAVPESVPPSVRDLGLNCLDPGSVEMFLDDEWAGGLDRAASASADTILAKYTPIISQRIMPGTKLIPEKN